MIIDPSTLIDKVLRNYDPRNLQPNSYDLRVASAFQILGGITLFREKQRDGYDRILPKYREVPPQHGWIHLQTGILYQLEMMEIVEIPDDICGMTIMRSSMAKSGASGEMGLYDSGYTGSCGMTVSVKHGCHIEVGASVAQLIFMEAKTSKTYEGMYLDSRWHERLI